MTISLQKNLSTIFLCCSFFAVSSSLSACSAKNNSIPEIQESPTNNSMTNNNSSDSSSTDNKPPPPPPKIQNNTSVLVKEGILEEVPSSVKVGEEFTITFRTMYPNGCWMQSEPTHVLDESINTYMHSYSTTYEAEGRMCTMGFKQGGFQVTLSSKEVGTLKGEIFVDENLRTSYTIDVTSD
jgi:hypothetical protein